MSLLVKFTGLTTSIMNGINTIFSRKLIPKSMLGNLIN